MQERTDSFGYWLRRRRRALDLTQDELARSVACSHFAIRKIEADERRPSRALAERLAERLGITSAQRERFVAAARGVGAVSALGLDALPLTLATPSTVAAFVGRADVLAALDGALAQALDGRTRIVLLAGQPGIGKTRTAQELARRAAAAGCTVLWGRCPEEPGAPPFWPWIQLLRGALEGGIDATDGAGASRTWIAAIVPEIAGPADTGAAAAVADSAQARFALFDAITGFWKRASSARPILLVLDDLHSADVASLRMLDFLARETRDAPLLVAGTFRDAGLDRRHPLVDTLGALAREPHALRIALGGLALEETRALVATAGLAEASVARLHTQSEGNPFYANELARYLAKAPADAGGPRLPAGICEAIGARLNRLSAPCNALLADAAVIGREFELPVLLAMGAGRSEDAGIAAIEEALAAGVIEELADADAYRFAHALLRETLYEEIPAIRRPRLHERVGAGIEAAYATSIDTQLSRLVAHYGAAASAHGAAKALEFARRAGGRAMQLGAHEEAARHFQTALDALSAVERQDVANAAARCDLLTSKGEAQTAAAEYSSARDTLRAAADLAAAADAAEALARVAIAFEDASWRPGLTGEEAIGLLRDALGRIDPADLRTRARLQSALTRALIFTGADADAIAIHARAVADARAAGDARTLAAALCSGLTARWHPERIDMRLAVAAEAIAIGRAGNDRGFVLEAMSWRLFDRMERGVDANFQRDYAEFTALAEEMRLPFFLYTSRVARSALALMAGDLTGAEREAQALRELGARQSGLDAEGVHATQMFTLRREQGQLAVLAPLVRHFVANTDAAARWRPGLALVYAELGMADDARRELDMLARDDFAGIARDGMWAASIAYLAEVSAALGDAPRSAALTRLLTPHAGHNLLAGTAVACFGAADRFLGMLATVERRWEAAENHLQQAIEINARQGALTWVAHSQYEYARMLIARGEPGDAARARALADRALTCADTIGLTALAAKLQAL